MTDVVGVVTQEPAFVGWVAALAVLIFLSVVFLLLVVAAGNDSLPLRWTEEEPLVDEPVAQKPVAQQPVVPEPRLRQFRMPEPRVPQFRMPEPRVPEAVVKEPASGASGVADMPRSAVRVSAAGESYAASMARSLHGMALAVVQGAQLRAGDRILDAGSGAVIAASAALVTGLAVVPVDPDQGTLAIGRREARGARAAGADFAPLPFGGSWFDVVISVHSLHFAADPAGVLAEWRRVTRAGGRLSLSVPGPRAALAMSTYSPIYRRHGAGLQVHLPTRRKLSEWASTAGWQQVDIVADPKTVIQLPDADSFHTWMRTRTWSDPERGLSLEHLEALEQDLIAAFSIGPDGRLQIPFGTLYLTARNP